MNTLYDILEVSEKASKEVIEKAYRVLAKKYHPDLQTSESKLVAEEKMKQINEAYDILSNDIKRKEYDEELNRKREKEENRNSENNYDKVADMRRRRYEEQLRKEVARSGSEAQQNLQNEYESIYYHYIKSLWCKIKENWTWKKTKKLLVIIMILIIVIAILWILPPTHNMMVNFYESNKLVKIIVDIIGGIIIAIFKTIGSIFK